MTIPHRLSLRLGQVENSSKRGKCQQGETQLHRVTGGGGGRGLATGLASKTGCNLINPVNSSGSSGNLDKTQMLGSVSLITSGACRNAHSRPRPHAPPPPPFSLAMGVGGGAALHQITSPPPALPPSSTQQGISLGRDKMSLLHCRNGSETLEGPVLIL